MPTTRVAALRLIQGDAPVERTDQVVSRHPGQRVPDKTDRTSIGLCATGRRQVLYALPKTNPFEVRQMIHSNLTNVRILSRYFHNSM